MVIVILIGLGIFAEVKFLKPMRIAKKEIENLQSCDFTVRYHTNMLTGEEASRDKLWEMLNIDPDRGVLQGKKRGETLQVQCYTERKETYITEVFMNAEEQKFNVKPIYELTISGLQQNMNFPLSNMIPQMQDCYVSMDQIRELFDLEETKEVPEQLPSDVLSKWDSRAIFLMKKCDIPADSEYQQELQTMKLFSLANPENENQIIIFGINGKVPKDRDTLFVRFEEGERFIEFVLEYEVSEEKETIILPANTLSEKEIQSLKNSLKMLRGLGNLVPSA